MHTLLITSNRHNVLYQFHRQSLQPVAVTDVTRNSDGFTVFSDPVSHYDSTMWPCHVTMVTYTEGE